MTNLEKELKRHVDKIIDYAYRDDPDPFKDSYKWYKILIMNEPNKRIHGCYYPTGANKYTICLYQNAENKETDADRFLVLIHEVSHHLQHRRNRVNNNPKLYKDQSEAHEGDFWTEYQKMLYATLDLGYLTIEQMRDRTKDEAYADFVDGMLGDYESHIPENMDDYNDEQIYVFNSFGAKDELKKRHYSWNSLNSSWYITLEKNKINSEIEALHNIGIDTEDIEVAPFNVLKMISDEQHYKPLNKVIKANHLELYSDTLCYLLNIEKVNICNLGKFNEPSYFDAKVRTVYYSQYDDSSPKHCIRVFYQIAQHIYNAYQAEYSLDSIKTDIISNDGLIYSCSSEYGIQSKGFALYVVSLLFKADISFLQMDLDKEKIEAAGIILGNQYTYEKITNAYIVAGFNAHPIAYHLKKITKQLNNDLKSGRLETEVPQSILCFDCETTGTDSDNDEILQLSMVNGMGEVLFNELIKPHKTTSWPGAEKVNHITYDMVKNAQEISYYTERIQTLIERADVLVGYNIGFDLGFLASAGLTFKDKVIYDVMKEFSNQTGEWDEEKKRYKWYKLTSCAEHFKYQWKGEAHDSLADAQATLYCYYRIEELKKKNK